MGETHLRSFTDKEYEQAFVSARKRVRKAWKKARDRTDRKPWHRLRIAIKGLRYTVDAISRRSARDELRFHDLAALCREALQFLLQS